MLLENGIVRKSLQPGTRCATHSLDKETIHDPGKTMKKVMVSELKAKLSAYLSEVRKGETVVVCDRKTPVARLIPYAQAPDELGVEEPVITDREPAWPKPVQLRKKVNVVKLLREDRDQR